MTNPITPNYVPGVGRLVTDRFDFQKHIDGTDFRHQANQIDLSPALTVASITYHNAQDILAALAALIVPPTIPLATNSTTGIIRLAGDLNGSGSTALVPKVSGLQGYPINTTPPTSGNVLGWNGTSWGPVSGSAGGSAGGDLRGTYPNPLVKSITGASPISGLITALVGDSVNDLLITPPINTIGDGYQLTISAQDALASGDHVGGSLFLKSGNKHGAGSHGQWALGDQAGTCFILGLPNTGINDGFLFLKSSNSIFAGTGADNLLTIGGGGLQLGHITIPLSPTSGVMTLTPDQYKFPYLIFTGTLTGNLTIVLPSLLGGTWYIDANSVDFTSPFTIRLNANSSNWGTLIEGGRIYRVIYTSDGQLFGSTLT